MSTNSSTDKQPRREITRRDFLKLAGAAGAFLVTLPSFIPFGQVVVSSGTNSSTNINRTTSNLDTSINKQTSSVHIFNLDGAIPQFQSPTGSRTLMNADNFPILSGMGAVLLLLKKGGVREPHWHPNASELGYCITGNARMTIFMTNARHVTFTINPGQLIFIPRGYWHDIENIGKEEAKFVIVYNNERPEDLGITGSVGSMSARVLDRIFGIRPPGLFDQLNYKSSQDVIVGAKPADFSSSSRIELPNTDTNSYKYSLGSIIPQIQTSGGTASFGNCNFFSNPLGIGIISNPFETKWNSRASYSPKCS